MSPDAIVRCLLEDDGACRDINFSEHISTAGAQALVTVIAIRWQLTRATDGDGNAIAQGTLQDCLSRPSGALSKVWQGPAIPRHLQAFFHWTCIDRVFCELTFFPADLDRPRFVLEDFLRVLAVFVLAAQSDEYYVRFEDASWSHAASSSQSVIFSHETMPLKPVV